MVGECPIGSALAHAAELGTSHSFLMLNGDDLIEADGIADQLRVEAGYRLDETVDIAQLAQELTGLKPQRLRMRVAGAFNRADPRPRLYTRAGLPEEREPWVLGHELGHWHFWRLGRALDPLYEERMADAIGAALVAPRVPFRMAGRRSVRGCIRSPRRSARRKRS